MIQRYPQFWLFRKGPGTSFSTTFCIWFFKKKYFSCNVLLTDQIWPNLTKFVWFLFFLEILGNMCIVYLFCIYFYISIICFTIDDVTNFEIKLEHDQRSGQKFKHLKNEKSFQVEIKRILDLFWRAFRYHRLTQTWESVFKTSSKMGLGAVVQRCSVKKVFLKISQK